MKTPNLSALVASCLLPAASFAITDGTETFSVADASLLSGVSVGAAGVTVSDVQGWDFTVFSATASTVTSMDIWDGAVGSGNGVAFYETDSSNDVFFSAVRITPTGDFRFDLDSIGLNLQLWNGSATVNGQLVTVSGLDENGDLITGATLSAAVNDALLVTFNTSGISEFAQISGILITPNSGAHVMSYGFIDNIAVSSVTAVPEPATWASLAGVLALGFVASRRRRAM